MKRFSVVTLIALGFLIVGCADAGPAPEAETAAEMATETEAAAAAMSPEELETAMASLLVKADLADETEDHVVEKCLGCALAMDGSPDHAVQAHGYEIHFCSAGCMERADEDIDKAILALGELDEAATEATY